LDRFEKAKLAVCVTADEWCWESSNETERKLRDAVAEWRTALGLLRLHEYTKYEGRID